MIRIEIIANNTVEEDIQEALNKIEPGFYYTRFNNVHGRGSSSPRMGDAVWPEENFVYVIYTDEEKAKLFMEAIRQIKMKFTQEGIKAYAIPFEGSVEL